MIIRSTASFVGFGLVLHMACPKTHAAGVVTHASIRSHHGSADLAHAVLHALDRRPFATHRKPAVHFSHHLHIHHDEPALPTGLFSSSVQPAARNDPYKRGGNASEWNAPKKLAGSGSTNSVISRRAGAGRLPVGFKWRAYMRNYPHLMAQGIRTEDAAIGHYLLTGKERGAIYYDIPVLMRYTACGGLINQLYSHIAAVSLAATAGYEMVLAPGLTRSSFAHYYHMDANKNEVSWNAVPLDTLFNVQRWIKYWQRNGVFLYAPPPLTGFPDVTRAETAYMQYDMPAINEENVVKMTDVYQGRMPLQQLVDAARRRVAERAEQLMRKDPAHKVEYIVLDLPCTFFSLAHLSTTEVAVKAARSLTFSMRVTALADRVLNSIARQVSNMGRFNGIHLRMEKDAQDWATIMGGPGALWHLYMLAIKQVAWDNTLPVYAATGLLTYGADSDMQQVRDILVGNGVTTQILQKEMFLSENDLKDLSSEALIDFLVLQRVEKFCNSLTHCTDLSSEQKALIDFLVLQRVEKFCNSLIHCTDLSSEQKALIDFLVLQRVEKFVGLGSSTFSYYLRELRAMQGIPKTSSVLANVSRIGTDELFRECGTIVP